jgi:uncharacterized damage-inducible protein DinB
VASTSLPEVWLRGPVEGVDPFLLPAAHALLQVAEELQQRLAGLTVEQLWARPGGAGSIGFHALHVCGATERLLTYARGEALSPEQVQAARAEAQATGLDGAALCAKVEAAVGAALAQLRATPRERLLEPREVGKLKLPSTVLGLIFHAAEHASRHAGQIATTAKQVQGA